MSPPRTIGEADTVITTEVGTTDFFDVFVSKPPIILLYYIFVVLYETPFRFRAKPLLTLFCPAAITFIGYRLRRAFSPTFIIFSEAGLHGSPLPHPKRGPRGVSNICAVLPQFNTGLGTVKATKYHS